MLKHYVEFDTPGVLLPETEVREVKTRFPADLENIPEYTYAINFFDQQEVTKQGEVLTGSPKNKSPRIVFGQVYTKDQLLELGFTEDSHLYHNAYNSEGKVIKCIAGNWQPWDKDWIILRQYSDLKALKDLI